MNPSWEAVRIAAVELEDAGYEVHTTQLPCIFGDSADVLRAALRAVRPDVVLSVGQAGGRERLSLERVAINVDDARIRDNAGNTPIDAAVVDGGPAAYFSTLPVKSCLQELTGRGVAAEISQTAGTFVCNHVFYALMHELGGGSHPRTKGGFIHIPFAPEQVPDGSAASMELATAAAGLAAVARVSLRAGQDMAIGAGDTH